MRYGDKSGGQAAFPRVIADPREGLSDTQVNLRREAGAVNEIPSGITPSYPWIFYRNIFTLFNIINLLLALLLAFVGYVRNAVFFGVAVFNTCMCIVQEIRAKRTLDKLSILSEGEVRAVRGGREITIPQGDVVPDDILVLSLGDQVCADAEALVTNGLEVNEALLTGEADNVAKNVGSQLLSGSFVAAGSAYARVTEVGARSYANRLTMEAKSVKKPRTPMMRSINRIIRALTFVIIPIGILLFIRRRGDGIPDAVLGASAAMIGMIPEGLVLLTGITMTIGALRLARASALVRTLPGIETLARTDVLCLDKTGTMTDGTLELYKILPAAGHGAEEAGEAISEIMGALGGTDAVSSALRGALGQSAGWEVASTVPFSSERKWSGAHFKDKGIYVLGAPRIVMPDDCGGIDWEEAEFHARNGRRVLCLAFSGLQNESLYAAYGAQAGGIGEHAESTGEQAGNYKMSGPRLPKGLECVALIALSDALRAEAAETFRFFAGEGVEIKVISGDDPLTVASIAEKAGVEGFSRYIDMSAVNAAIADYSAIAAEYAVFGRASPRQKKDIVAAMKKNGRTVCMTGDGVNDVLAMKEADCSVAMRSGSGAARGVCDFVLMTSDFSSMKKILYEGRRVINNIETVSALYIIRTIYSAILSVLYLLIPAPFPFAPIQVTPINALTVGAPSFFLTLRSNFKKPENRFGRNILEYSLPAAVTIVFNIIIVHFIGIRFHYEYGALGMMRVIATAAAGFYTLFLLSRPKGAYMLLFCAFVAAFCTVVAVFSSFLGIHFPTFREALPFVTLAACIPAVFAATRKLAEFFAKKLH